MKQELNDFKYLKNIAIFGGTFNPIHYGHLSIAETVRQEFEIEKVFFMPNGNPPHKSKNEVASGEHRYLMCVLATLSNQFFDVLRIEIDKKEYSYTVDTLTEIRSKCLKDTVIYLILGADAFIEIFSWKDYRRLFTLCQFIVVGRPGCNKDELQNFIAELKNDHGVKAYYLEMPLNPISSTDIRNRLQSKQSIKYLTPLPVEEYIYKNDLYHESFKFNSINLNLICSYLRERLSEGRFNHTIGVADTSVTLAKIHNADEDKAYVAGLLHDIAKEIPNEEKLKLCSEYGIETDPIMKSQPELLHSFLSAELSAALFGIDDPDILNAISYHTTGRTKMSCLEKIVFLADMCEPGRKNNEGIADIRKTAYNDLDKAMLLGLKHKIDYTMKKGHIVHPLSTDALSYYEKR